MILVDSNVWIYYLDTRLPEHPKVGYRLPILLEDEDALIPAIVQMEVIHYVVGRMGKGASGVVDTFLAFPGEVEPLAGRHVAEAARLLLSERGNGIRGRDAALLVTAQRAKATLATADKPLAKVAKKMGVRTVNPAT